MTTLKNFTDADARITLEASADMDNAYRAVKQGATNTDTCDICSVAGERAIGVIDQSWDDGEFCSIIRAGVATIVAGAAVASGAVVAVDTSARAITATHAHEWQLGYALSAASAADDEISILIAIAPIDTASMLGYGHKVAKGSLSAPQAETDLFTLPTYAIVVDAFVLVTTAEATGATKTLDVGTSTVSNDPDGFLDGVSVAATGIVKATATYTTGSNEVYFASSTYGDLLAPTQVAGTDLATDVGTYYEEKNDITSLGAVVSATPGSLADFAELVADVYVVYVELG